MIPSIYLFTYFFYDNNPYVKIYFRKRDMDASNASCVALPHPNIDDFNRQKGDGVLTEISVSDTTELDENKRTEKTFEMDTVSDCSTAYGNLEISLRNSSSEAASSYSDISGHEQIKNAENPNEKHDITLGRTVPIPSSEKLEIILTENDKSGLPPVQLYDKQAQGDVSTSRNNKGKNEYQPTGERFAKNIQVVRDVKTDKEHVIKKEVMGSFNILEFRCWIAMQMIPYVPDLLFIEIIDDKKNPDLSGVLLHMEKIEGKTVHSVIEEDSKKLFSTKDWGLVKLFSHHLLVKILKAIEMLHGTGWVHRDLHGKNIMVVKVAIDRFDVKILDFGRARQLNDCSFLERKKDMLEVIRLFITLYIGFEFQSTWHMENNFESELKNYTKFMEEVDRKELMQLVRNVMKVSNPDELQKFMNYLNKLQEEMSLTNQRMKIIVALIFPEDSLQRPLVKSSCDTDSSIIATSHSKHTPEAETVVLSQDQVWGHANATGSPHNFEFSGVQAYSDTHAENLDLYNKQTQDYSYDEECKETAKLRVALRDWKYGKY